MIKSELIDALSKQQPHLLPYDVELAVNCILEHMAQTLEAGGRIEIRGFGAFSLHYRPARMGRNPSTGESVSLPEKVAIHFKPSKEMKSRVNASRNHCKIRDEVKQPVKKGHNILSADEGQPSQRRTQARP
jgi:integration host factor subunit beta